MAANDGYRRYVEAAAALGQITRARAEEIMREVMSGGDVSRAQAQEWVDEMVDRSRKATEGLVEMVRAEVSSQMEALGVDPEKLARQAADLLRRSAEAGRRVMQDVAQSRGTGTRPATKASGGTAEPARAPATTAPATRAAGTKAAGKRAAGTKAATTKASATKASATKASAKKASATKASAKRASAKKAPATKTAAAKASAKKAPAKKAPGAARAAAKKRGSGTTS